MIGSLIAQTAIAQSAFSREGTVRPRFVERVLHRRELLWRAGGGSPAESYNHVHPWPRTSGLGLAVAR